VEFVPAGSRAAVRSAVAKRSSPRVVITAVDAGSLTPPEPTASVAADAGKAIDRAKASPEPTVRRSTRVLNSIHPRNKKELARPDPSLNVATARGYVIVRLDEFGFTSKQKSRAFDSVDCEM
jgi:hypothetical protein